MTVADRTGPVPGPDGLLVAWCPSCRAHLEQVPGTDAEQVTATFLAAHPPAGGLHGRDRPRGWWVPASWPGALSQ